MNAQVMHILGVEKKAVHNILSIRYSLQDYVVKEGLHLSMERWR